MEIAVSSFTIRELTGDKRTLTLRERALPYRPFELSGTHRNSVDWYPGSPVGTMQVYGAKEEGTTIQGIWKTKYLGAVGTGAAATVESRSALGGVDASVLAAAGLDASAVLSSALVLEAADLVSAQALCKLVDDIRRKGQEVEVTWLNQVRRGILERFTQKWENASDVGWEMMFTWISQGDELDTTAFVDNNATDLADVPSKIQSAIDAIDSSIQSSVLDQLNAIESRLNGLAHAIDATANALQDGVDALQDSLVQVTRSITAPAESLRRTSGILDGIKTQGALLRSLLQDKADGAVLNETADTISAFGQKLLLRNGVRLQADAARSARDTAASEQSKLMASITADVIRIFQATDGQDLRQVSIKFYGTEASWRGLMYYNNLRTSRLSAGQVVFVPQQPPQDVC